MEWDSEEEADGGGAGMPSWQAEVKDVAVDGKQGGGEEIFLEGILVCHESERNVDEEETFGDWDVGDGFLFLLLVLVLLLVKTWVG